MTAKAQVKTQAKTPAAARIPQPPVAEPEHEAERPDIAAQLEGAARLGHSFGTLGVDRPAPPILNSRAGAHVFHPNLQQALTIPAKRAKWPPDEPLT